MNLSRVGKRILFFRLKCLVAFLFIFAFSVQPSSAQGSFLWSKQEQIPMYLDATEEPPYLIADSNRTVHAFNSQPLDLDDPDSPSTIFYRQWTLEGGWTFPIDILYDSQGEDLFMLGVAGDQSDRVHLIFLKNGSVYYVQNYLAQAGSAQLWPAPTLIGGGVSGYGPGSEIVGAIATSPDGIHLVVVFASRQSGNGLYFTSSADGGNNWTDPYPVYLTGDSSLVVTDPKLFVGESGIFHAVWTTFLRSGDGGPGFYANFDPELFTWSEPVELDDPGIRTPSVIEALESVFVSYYHNNVNGNWWRRSMDGGKTWSLPEQISPQHIGTNGTVSFAVDSQNVLHAFFGERINDLNHGMWHVKFTGATWGSIETVVRGPQRKEETGGLGFDPRSARAVIVNGNLVLLTWGTDGFAGTNGAWYSYRFLDAPELPTVALAAPTAVVIGSTAIPTEAPAATKATSTLVMEDGDVFIDSPSIRLNPQTSIFMGVIPVFLLLAGMIVMYHLFQNKNK